MTASDAGVAARPVVPADAARLSRLLILVIGSLTVVRLVIAAVAGLSYDEAVLAVKAHDLRLSYFDHPPLASLLIAAAQGLTGSDAVLVMRLPAIALFAATTWTVYRIGSLLFGPLAGFCGAIALSLSPLFSLYFGSFALTDAPLLFCVAAATLCLCHGLFGSARTTAWWLGAGLFTGLALLSKSFSAVLLMLGLAGFLLATPRHRHWFARPAPYLAAAVALAVMTPVIVWNAHNEWITFLFPGGHPIAGDWGLQQTASRWTFRPLQVLTYWGVQALIIMPWIWFGLVAALVWGFSRGPGSEGTWLLSWLAAAPLAAFTLVRLLSTDRKGFHWAAPGYLVLFPLLGLMIERTIRTYWTPIRRLTVATVALVALAGVVAVGHIVTGWAQRLPQLAHRNDDPILNDLVAWDALRDALARHRPKARDDMFVAGMRWEDCAKIAVAIRMAHPVLCLTPFPEVFAYLTDPRPLLGKDAIIVARAGQDVAGPLASYFERIEPLESVVVTHFGTRARVLDLYRGQRLRALYPWPYGPYRAKAKPGGAG